MLDMVFILSVCNLNATDDLYVNGTFYFGCKNTVEESEIVYS